MTDWQRFGESWLMSLAVWLLLAVVAAVVVLAVVAGCVAPGAAQVDAAIASPAVEISPSPMIDTAVDISPAATISPAIDASGDRATSQPLATDSEVTAGRDARPVIVTVSASGSAWPVAALLLAVGAVGLVALQRSTAKGRARDRSNAGTVAGAIRDMGPGPQRDRLLAMIEQTLRYRADWEELIGDRRVRRPWQARQTGNGSDK